MQIFSRGFRNCPARHTRAAPFLQVAAKSPDLPGCVQFGDVRMAVSRPEFTSVTCRCAGPMAAHRATDRRRTCATCFSPQIFTSHNAVGHKFRKGSARQAVPDSCGICHAAGALRWEPRIWATTPSPSEVVSAPGSAALAFPD